MMKHPRCSLALAIIAVGVVVGVIFQNELFFAYLLTLQGLLIAVPFTLLIGVFSLSLVISKTLPEDSRPGPRLGKVMSYIFVGGLSSVNFTASCQIDCGAERSVLRPKRLRSAVTSNNMLHIERGPTKFCYEQPIHDSGA